MSVTGATTEAIRRAREAAEADADLVELQLDFMTRPDPAGAHQRPAEARHREAARVRERGQFAGPEADRLRILREAFALGDEYVDVEWEADSVIVP